MGAGQGRGGGEWRNIGYTGYIVYIEERYSHIEDGVFVTACVISLLAAVSIELSFIFNSFLIILNSPPFNNVAMGISHTEYTMGGTPNK